MWEPAVRMRVLEIALLAVLAIPLIGLVVRPSLARLSVLPGVAALVVGIGVAHLIVEGMRWQLAPAYLVATTLVAVVAARGRRGPLDRRRPGGARLVGGAGLLALAAAAAVGWALPVVALPGPDGPRPVGTFVLALADEERPEQYSGRPGDHRRIAVQAWYPAREGGPPAPWAARADRLGARLGRQAGVPGFVLGHLQLLRSHATTGAPIDEAGPYPVVVYSHGWSAFRGAQSVQMEQLASHGYVALAIDHTYGSLTTVFPDGEVVAIRRSALPDDAPPEIYAAAAERLVATFAADIGLVLDRLHAISEREPFRGLLDLSRVAVMGHSAGGGAAVMACATDSDCDAVVGLDAWVEPIPDDVIGSGLDQPMLSLRSAEWLGNDNDARLRRLHVASSTPARLAHIEGTRHPDFTVLSLLTPLATELGIAGETDARRTHAIVDASLLDFFDGALRGSEGQAPGSPPRGFVELVDDGLVGGDES